MGDELPIIAGAPNSERPKSLGAAARKWDIVSWLDKLASGKICKTKMANWHGSEPEKEKNPYTKFIAIDVTYLETSITSIQSELNFLESLAKVRWTKT